MRARPAPPSVRRWRFAFRRSTALAVAASILLAPACSDDDPSAADSSDDSTTTSRPTTTTEADTASEDSDALRTEIQELLESYDALLGELAAQPDEAADRDNPAYDELRALLTPESPMTEPLINGLVSAGSRGERQLPNGSHRYPVERRVEGRIRPASSSEYKVTICGHMNYGVFNAQNQQIELAEDHVEATDATIVRTGDELRIHTFESLDPSRCQEADG